MASAEQLQKWCAQILDLVDNGTDNVNDIIAARGGKRMSTLLAINTLIASRTLYRQGNLVWRIDKGLFPTHR